MTLTDVSSQTQNIARQRLLGNVAENTSSDYLGKKCFSSVLTESTRVVH